MKEYIKPVIDVQPILLEDVLTTSKSNYDDCVAAPAIWF